MSSSGSSSGTIEIPILVSARVKSVDNEVLTGDWGSKRSVPVYQLESCEVVVLPLTAPMALAAEQYDFYAH